MHVIVGIVIVILFINSKQASLVLVCKHYWRVINCIILINLQQQNASNRRQPPA